MRRRFLIGWAAIRWILLTLLIAEGMGTPVVVHPHNPVHQIKVFSAVASWYGPNFQGRTTASGAVFDMYKATAASRTLPLGSLLRLYNPKTHASQVVRINDRGPYVKGRDLDVSYLVACRLGMEQEGVSRLQVELLKVPKKE